MEYPLLFHEIETIWQKHKLTLLFYFIDSVKDTIIGHYNDLGILYYMTKFLVENGASDSDCSLLFNADKLSDFLRDIIEMRKIVQRLNYCEEFSLDDFSEYLVKYPISSEELTWLVFSSCTDVDYVLGRLTGNVSSKILNAQTDYFSPNISSNNDIAFIICTNKEDELSETLYYINRLHKPENCNIDILTVYDASSMCSGYNEGMNSSSAKYKIYLHQDVRIIDRYFLYYLVNIFFKNSNLGILGMVGAKEFSKDGYVWHTPLHGSWIEGKAGSTTAYQTDVQNLTDVMLLDGFLLATQYDIPWREDLFQGFHFYDASQCMEFRKKGYAAAVPRQESPWCLHNCGWSDTKGYLDSSKLFYKEYNKYF